MSFLCYLCLLRIMVSTYWLYVWVTWRVSYKRQEMLTLREHQSSRPFLFLVGSVLQIFLVFCVVLFCLFTFWVRRCDVRYHFRIKTMFGSSLPPVGGLMSYLRYLCLLAHSGVHHILCCVFVWFFFVLCTHVDSFSGLSIFDCPFGILLRLCNSLWPMYNVYHARLDCCR